MILKHADDAPLGDRIRRHRLCLALVCVSQGVAFVHAGDPLLRSKSLDRDSYNSGGKLRIISGCDPCVLRHPPCTGLTACFGTATVQAPYPSVRDCRKTPDGQVIVSQLRAATAGEEGPACWGDRLVTSGQSVWKRPHFRISN